MSAHDLIEQSIAAHRRNEWYYLAFQRDNPALAPAVIAYLDGGARPSDALIGENHYARGLVLAEEARRVLVPPPLAGFDIPYWRVTLPASPSGPIARWRMYKTATSTIVDASPHMPSPAFPRPTVGPKSWEWWVLGSVVIPASFPTVGRSFATIDPHTAPGDVGGIGGVHGGIGWGFGSGVANVHIFYSNGRPEDETQGANDFGLYIDPAGSRTHWKLIPDVVRDRRYDFAYQLIYGRLDKELGLAGPGVAGGGIGDHPNGGAGRVRQWVDGNLIVDTGNINTLQRSARPSDGKLFTQTLLYRPWDGTYSVPNLSAQITMERSASRVGRTLPEALADGKDGFTLVSEWEGGSTRNLAPLRISEFRAPVL